MVDGHWVKWFSMVKISWHWFILAHGWWWFLIKHCSKNSSNMFQKKCCEMHNAVNRISVGKQPNICGPREWLNSYLLWISLHHVWLKGKFRVRVWSNEIYNIEWTTTIVLPWEFFLVTRAPICSKHRWSNMFARNSFRSRKELKRKKQTDTG